MSHPLAEHPDGSVTLTLHVQPGARKTELAGLHGEAIKLRLSAPPVDGKANAALCAFFADFFDVPKSAVSLLTGDTSRAKRLRVNGAAPAAVRRLRELLG
ncbi:MAG: DUF167 domain-containing protein [Zoogloea sp.]|nr:DUF167 domain-containing protein [Zoogloea sp.]